ncbi:MAG: phenylalanine--tRNA ligase subunit beta [Muribaculaceae bacterium]|nr:phenylalanine--tRNA ligase subunit beta [Muribaculaceae bacterium]
MNISYNWLHRFIDFDLDPRQLASALTSLGLECDNVEEVESIPGGLKGIVIGKVLTCEPHPDSDHLHITTVDLGDSQPATIVCGAPNVAAGQTVVVATVGTVLKIEDKEIKIKKSKIRGVESSGMICAEDEIGVGKSHEGIIVIEEDIKPGTPAASYFKLESDYCLEVELTPNRVDAASHLGVARDLKALLACRMAEEESTAMPPMVNVPTVESFSSDRKDGAVTIKVEDKEACPRYSGVTIRGVKVQESPKWLKDLLTATGQRPINNIVDITNFILLGFGQPLHCFDLGKVKGEEIVVRTCKAGTKFTTLDGVEHTLHEKDLMICDAEKPMCIAGVFGGLDSGVTENTTSVFIESAYFNPTWIRKTARRHSLSTDASFRYERGADPSITVYAAKLAALMIKELAGGEICGDIEDIYPEPILPAMVDLSLDYCKNLIGKEIPEHLIITILKALDIEIEKGHGNEGVLTLKIPTYRVDVTRQCDVVEDILRVYGYNKVEFGMEMHYTPSQQTATDLDYALRELVSNRLTGEGFMEILNNSLSSTSYYENSSELPLDNTVVIMNPLSNDLAVMRATLLYGGLEAIAYNINRKAENLRFYEFGNVYHRKPGVESTPESPLKPFTEWLELGLWLTGEFITPGWNRQKVEASAFDMKGIVENLFKVLGISEKNLIQTQDSSELMEVRLNYTTRQGQRIGEVGIVSPKILKKTDINQSVIFASLNWAELMKQASRHKVTYTPLPKTQPVKRDLALLINKTVTFAQIEEIVRKTEKKLLKSVTLFDVYEGKNLPEGKKSYGITITLQDDEKTMNDQQIDAVMQKIIKALEASGATLR